jgi:hypothetical protein
VRATLAAMALLTWMRLTSSVVLLDVGDGGLKHTAVKES